MPLTRIWKKCLRETKITFNSKVFFGGIFGILLVFGCAQPGSYVHPVAKTQGVGLTTSGKYRGVAVSDL
ncbi:MAG: hypothetical protein KKH68_05085, partial [Proteobacteria bacterium]|nr:hypothetical protein [Pseudomonadota bacterium]